MSEPAPIRILVLTQYGRLGASSRLRFFQYFPYLRENGVEVTAVPLLTDRYLHDLYTGRSRNWPLMVLRYWKRLMTLLTARKFDLIWLEKELFPNLPAWFEGRLNRCGIPYVVDYDDATFHHYDTSSNAFKRLLAGKIDQTMKRAATVVCGNAYLAQRARDAGAQPVEIIPTVIDLDRYAVSEREAGDEIVIGWVGSPSTAKYLDIVMPVFEQLSRSIKLKLHVVGADVAGSGVEVHSFPWIEEQEVAEIQGFDIGIMPLYDSPWERGKCGYKLIQYMACGLPVVASPVGVNQTIVKDGENGCLAANSDDWFRALERLCQDAALRRTMGLQGRRDVESSYCVKVTAPKVLETLTRAWMGNQRDA